MRWIEDRRHATNSAVDRRYVTSSAGRWGRATQNDNYNMLASRWGRATQNDNYNKWMRFRLGSYMMIHD
jgi:hypothetical protein